MGLGVGLILAAVGAVLAFAVNATVSGVDIHTIGWILLIVGIVGILLSLVFWSSWAGPGLGRDQLLRRAHGAFDTAQFRVQVVDAGPVVARYVGPLVALVMRPQEL